MRQSDMIVINNPFNIVLFFLIIINFFMIQLYFICQCSSLFSQNRDFFFIFSQIETMKSDPHALTGFTKVTKNVFDAPVESMAISVSENSCNTNSRSERKMLFVEMQPEPVSGISVNVTPCLPKVLKSEDAHGIFNNVMQLQLHIYVKCYCNIKV